MRKHKLEIGELKVDTFVAGGQPAERGTVVGQDGYYPTPSCGPDETYGQHTCFCLYPRTDERLCCKSDIWCTNGCYGGGTATCTCPGGGTDPQTV